MTWKIVVLAKASVLYIYIDNIIFFICIIFVICDTHSEKLKNFVLNIFRHSTCPSSQPNNI